jgi:DNA-binding NarL/FixJ family response regulator
MPGMTGLEVARRLEKGSKTAVILLTMFKDEDRFNQALINDVRGYLLKDSAEEHVLSAIRAVAIGDFYYSPEMSGLITKRERQKRGLESSSPGLDRLTKREREVLRLIADSRRSQEIADQLHISVRTVEYHRAQIGGKLGIKGSYSLLKFALENRSLL